MVVTARDAIGNALTSGGSTVVGAVTGPETLTPVVKDNLNGTYTLTYTPTVAGADKIAITLNGTAISGSQFTCVIAGLVSAANCTATITSPAAPTPNGGVNTLTTITVQACDAAGNPLTIGGSVFTGTVSGANAATLTF